MVEQIVDRFILYGILDDVKYSVKWSVMDSVSEVEKAEIAFKTAQAISAYSAPQMLSTDEIITAKQFVEDVLGMDYLEDDISQMQRELDVPSDEINTQA